MTRSAAAQDRPLTCRPRRPSFQQVTIDTIYDKSDNSPPPSFVDQFCAKDPSPAGCATAFLFAQDKGIGPAAWNT